MARQPEHQRVKPGPAPRPTLGPGGTRFKEEINPQGETSSSKASGASMAWHLKKGHPPPISPLQGRSEGAQPDSPVSSSSGMDTPPETSPTRRSSRGQNTPPETPSAPDSPSSGRRDISRNNPAPQGASANRGETPARRATRPSAWSGCWEGTVQNWQSIIGWRGWPWICRNLPWPCVLCMCALMGALAISGPILGLWFAQMGNVKLGGLGFCDG
jgi:hypothetical protein